MKGQMKPFALSLVLFIIDRKLPMDVVFPGGSASFLLVFFWLIPTISTDLIAAMNEPFPTPTNVQRYLELAFLLDVGKLRCLNNTLHGETAILENIFTANFERFTMVKEQANSLAVFLSKWTKVCSEQSCSKMFGNSSCCLLDAPFNLPIVAQLRAIIESNERISAIGTCSLSKNAECSDRCIAIRQILNPSSKSRTPQTIRRLRSFPHQRANRMYQHLDSGTQHVWLSQRVSRSQGNFGIPRNTTQPTLSNISANSSHWLSRSDGGLRIEPHITCLSARQQWVMSYIIPVKDDTADNVSVDLIVGVDLMLDSVDIDQCASQRMSQSTRATIHVAGSDLCHRSSTTCQPLNGLGFRSGISYGFKFVFRKSPIKEESWPWCGKGGRGQRKKLCPLPL